MVATFKLGIWLVGLLIAILTAWRHTYWWQVKEYRWDRMWSWIRFNQGWKELLGKWEWRQPDYTQRAKRMLGTAILLTGVVGGMNAGWISIVFMPVAAAVGVILGIWWTKSTVNRVTVRDVIEAKKIIEKFNPKVVAITGSFGKSSSKELVADILGQKWHVIKTIGTENTLLGIARRLLADLKPGVEVVVVEMGAYKRGEIAQICQMVQPDVAWITGIGSQHIDLFGGMENLKRAKFEIVEGLKPEGVAVFNKKAGEEDLIKWARKMNIKSVIYGASGRVGNEKGAIEIAKLMGLSQREIKVGLEKFKAANKWPVLKESRNGIIIMDESYNSNQQGFVTAVDYLKLNFSGKKYVVTPGIIELGNKTKKVHSEIGKKLVGLDGVWVTSDWARQDLGGRGDIKEMGKILKTGDVLLVEGRIPTKVKKMIFDL